MRKAVTAKENFDLAMNELNHGEAMDDLGEALQKVVEAVRTTGRSGEITYKVKVSPGERGQVKTVEVVDSINVKLPKMDRAKAMFFVTTDNKLSIRNPDQPELPLEDIPTAKPVAV